MHILDAACRMKNSKRDHTKFEFDDLFVKFLFMSKFINRSQSSGIILYGSSLEAARYAEAVRAAGFRAYQAVSEEELINFMRGEDDIYTIVLLQEKYSDVVEFNLLVSYGWFYPLHILRTYTKEHVNLKTYKIDNIRYYYSKPVADTDKARRQLHFTNSLFYRSSVIPMPDSSFPARVLLRLVQQRSASGLRS